MWQGTLDTQNSDPYNEHNRKKRQQALGVNAIQCLLCFVVLHR